MSDTSRKSKSRYRSCLDCKSDILQKDPDQCPYCGSVNIVTEEEPFANSPAEVELENAGNYKKMASLIQSNIVFYFDRLKQILDQPVCSFAEATFKQVPAVSGVYVINDESSNQMIYAATSKNLRVRLLQKHKKGNIRGSQFRKKLSQKHNLDSETKISKYISDNCSFRLLEVDSFKERIRLAHFTTAIMAPILNTELKQ